jgi:uncharacterized membrane protein
MYNNMSSQKSALGLDGNITALLGYLIWIVALISIIIEKENRFVRFHAFQALIWSVVVGVGILALWIVGAIVGAVFMSINQTLGGLVFGLLMLILVVAGLGAFIGTIFAAIKAFQGQTFKLPVVGNFAEKFSN